MLVGVMVAIVQITPHMLSGAGLDGVRLPA